MRKDEMNDRRLNQDEALAEFISYVEDPRLMDEEELDLFLAEAGFDLAAFDKRLDADIEKALRKAQLSEARASRAQFLRNQVRRAAETIAMTLEEKRSEIERRLGLLGSGQAAAVFNRNYESAADEEDLDDLLESLRALDERSDDASEG